MRFQPLHIYERYVLRQVAAPLFTAMIVGLLILFAERLVIVLGETMGKKNSFSIVFELISYWLPHYAGLAAPVAMYFGLLVGFSRLSRSSELDAFLASGLGLHQLVRPLVILSLVMCLFSLLMFGWLQPFALYAYRSLIHTVENVDVFYLAEEGVFMQAGKRTFMLDKLKRGDAAFERIFLFDNKGKDGAETITAARGTLAQLSEGGRPVLRLENGNRLEIASWPNYSSTDPLPRALGRGLQYGRHAAWSNRSCGIPLTGAKQSRADAAGACRQADQKPERPQDYRNAKRVSQAAGGGCDHSHSAVSRTALRHRFKAQPAGHPLRHRGDPSRRVP